MQYAIDFEEIPTPTVPAKLIIQQHEYICDCCGKPFNWDENSGWYGSYAELDAGKFPPVFCSDECGNKYRSIP